MRYSFPLSPYNQQRQFHKPVWIYPVHLAMFATYLRNKGHHVFWGMEEPESLVIRSDKDINVEFGKLPAPDRIFTNAKDPRYQSYGNFKYRPNTHMMISNLCWYGRCAFCWDAKCVNDGIKRQVRTVSSVMEEIDELIEQGYKEVFDDSGTFPIAGWLEDFCLLMCENNRRRKIKVGCNMRVQEGPWQLMSSTGFRFILFGIESANQFTLDKIKKGTRADQAIEVMKEASAAGLEPHGTFMTGYPWETEKDEKRTIDLCHFLLKRGYIKTAQVSVYSSPRSPADPNSRGNKYLPLFYDVYKSPSFWVRKLSDIRRWEDVTYLMRGAKLVWEEQWKSR